jgi:hypothetical protein
MRLKKSTLLWIALSVALFASMPARAQDVSQPPAGTWQVVLTFPDGSQSQELLTFTRDGRALTTFLPIAETPSSSRWGEWRRNGGLIDYTSYTILSADPSSGFLRGRCRLILTNAGGGMTGNCAAELIDPEGNVELSLTTLELSAKRLPLVPLS